MKNWNESYLDIDFGIDPSVKPASKKKGPLYGIVNLLEVRSSKVLRLYDASQNRGELEEKLQKGYRSEIKRYNKKEILKIYSYLRDSAMLYKMWGDNDKWDRYLEAADYFRREFGIKTK